jgi:hypothetical protein
MLCVVKTSFFCKNKDLNLKLENSFVEIASLQSMHNDMSAKPCENCNMIKLIYGLCTLKLICGLYTLKLQVNLRVPS